MCEAVQGLLQHYSDQGGCLPDALLVYRDGVSDSMYASVLQHEVEGGIRRACQAVSAASYQPKVTLWGLCVCVHMCGHGSSPAPSTRLNRATALPSLTAGMPGYVHSHVEEPRHAPDACERRPAGRQPQPQRAARHGGGHAARGAPSLRVFPQQPCRHSGRGAGGGVGGCQGRARLSGHWQAGPTRTPAATTTCAQCRAPTGLPASTCSWTTATSGR